MVGVVDIVKVSVGLLSLVLGILGGVMALLVFGLLCCVESISFRIEIVSFVVGGTPPSSGLSILASSTVAFRKASILKTISLLGTKSSAIVAISVFVLNIRVFWCKARRFSRI